MGAGRTKGELGTAPLEPAGMGIFGQAFGIAEQQVRALVTEHPGTFPTYTERGKWHFEDDPWAPTWSAGFLTGMLWLFARRDETGWWREQAEKYSLLIEPRKLDGGTHDIGFLFTPSWGRWHATSPSARTEEVLVDAGRTMARRFNERGHYLSTWVDDGSTFIDVMMNIGIVYQAAFISGDQNLSAIATAHGLTTRRYLVRGDGTSVHEAWFDPETGAFVRTATHQGYRSDSSWVRGHAWGVYGFGTAYSWTGDPRFLDTARLLADTYIERTGDELVPPNDWDDPHPRFAHESSAGAVTAAGLLQLADLLGEHGARYREYALRLVARLSGPEFLARPGSGWEGVIRHATYHLNNQVGVDESVMWGDHYYVEALSRILTTAPISMGGA